MRRLTAALLAALILMALAGCGREETPETTAPPPTEPPIVEIPFETEGDERPYLGTELNFWSVHAETDPAAGVILQAAEVFEQKTGAKVNLTWQAGELTEASEADIFQTSCAGIPAFALDLTELAAAADYEAHSHAPLRQQVLDRWGYLAAIPQVPYLEGLYYNREIFESCGITVPSTWEEFLTVCQKLRAAGWQSLVLNSEDGAKAVQMYLESVLGQSQLAALLDGDDLSEHEQGSLALQQLIDFANGGYAAHDAYPAGQNRMGLSNGAMTIGSNGRCSEIESSTLTDIAWGVMPWPGGGGYVDSDVLAIHSGCADPQAAFDFIMLLTTGDFDQLRADVTGGIPADPGNASAIAGAVEMLQSAQPRTMGSTSKAYNDLALQLWSGKYKTGAIFASAMEQLGGN